MKTRIEREQKITSTFRFRRGRKRRYKKLIETF
jgi:hypothetical protein